MMEPTLPPADQSLPSSDQENIPPRMVTLPPLNVLVPVFEEEEEIRVKECCQRTLAVCNQRAIQGRGAITKPFKRPARMQLASISKIITTLQDSCEQRQRVRRLQRGLGGYESSSESGVTNTQTYHSNSSSLPRASCHGKRKAFYYTESQSPKYKSQEHGTPPRQM